MSVASQQLQMEQSLDQLETVALWCGGAGTKVAAVGNLKLECQSLKQSQPRARGREGLGTIEIAM